MPVAPADDPTEAVVVLLRAVNVGGTGKVSMPALREAATSLGHTDIATYLATGNLVLRPSRQSTQEGYPGLTRALTDGLRDRLGLPLGLTVRTRSQIDAVVRDNPYPDIARDEPTRLVVWFLDGPVAPGPGRSDLDRYGRERVTWHGQEGYLHYPDGIGRSAVTGAVLDRLSGHRGTGRGWRTVLAVQELLHDRT